MLKVVVLLSGGGSNLQAIIDGIHNGSVTNTKIVGVISNNPTAYGLERAKANQIPTFVKSPKEYSLREEFEKDLLQTIQLLQPDLIVLAGFLVKIPKEMIQVYPNQIINVHPSLIPSFCGEGYYGIRVHEAALKRGVKLTGATVHYVDEGMDTGPIIRQKAIPVVEEDTAESLQLRVMQECEWILLPEVIHQIANHDQKTKGL